MPAQQKIFVRECTIGSGATESALGVDVGDMVLVAIETPATVSGATLNIKVSNHPGPYKDAYDQDGTQLAIPVGASRFVSIFPYTLAGARKIKLVTDVVTAGDEVYRLHFRHIE